MRQSVCPCIGFFIIEEGATVSTQSILTWVLTVTTRLLPSQSKTLAVLVAAAIRCERPNLAQIGRGMAGPITAKSAIKRAWRFTCNERIAVADGMAEIIAKLVRKRKKRLLVSFDWTEFRQFHTLMAAACIKGRSVPLLWASYPGWRLLRSQNSLEEDLLRQLRELIPESIRVVILADRGFGRAEWAAVCQELKFDYLVRIRPDVTVASKRYRGILRKYPVFKGIAHVLHDVKYRKDARVTHHIVIRWRPDLPKKRDEPWYLMTNLEGRAESLCQLYGCRMQVEELFRDQKNRRNGWALRNTRIQHADRFDRFLLILALAYLLLAGLGLQAKLDFEPSQWCTNTRNSECSVFTIGKAMLSRCNYDPDELLRRVRYATEQVAARWG
jgi:Transposase DDE domain